MSCSNIVALFILFIMGIGVTKALTVRYNVLFLINSKVGIGYEKARRSQSTVPFFFKVH
jgi:hypothetical protein